MIKTSWKYDKNIQNTNYGYGSKVFLENQNCSSFILYQNSMFYNDPLFSSSLKI